MSARTYPLEIEAVGDWGEELTGVYSKGHHAAGGEITGDPFYKAALKYLDEVLCWDAADLEELTPDAVHFETWRCVPVKREWEWVTSWREAKPGTPGAFPVTVLRIDY